MENSLRVCSKCKSEPIKKNSSYCCGCTKEYHKARYETKKEKLLDYQKQYIEKNKEKVLEKNRIYKAANAEKVKQCVKRWIKNNAGRFNAYCKNRRLSKIKATPNWLTNEDLLEIEKIYKLAQLKSKIFGVKYHVDHVLPIKGKTVCGLHVPNNLQVIPALENWRKGNRVF